MSKKRCSRCRQEKEVGEFARHRQMADGRQNWCKSCCRSHASLAGDTCVIPLRPGAAVVVSNLPTDLTPAEVERIRQFLLLLCGTDL